MVIIDRKRVPVVSSVVVSLDRDTSVSGRIDVTTLLQDDFSSFFTCALPKLQDCYKIVL